MENRKYSSLHKKTTVVAFFFFKELNTEICFIFDMQQNNQHIETTKAEKTKKKISMMLSGLLATHINEFK